MTQYTVEKEAKANGVKKTKTPRTYDSILKGALGLALTDRVELKKELSASIQNEVKNLQLAAEVAVNLSKE